MPLHIVTMIGLVAAGLAGGAGLTLTLRSQTTIACAAPVGSVPLPWPTAERLPDHGGATYQ